MSKLVDKERLAKLAQALDARMKAAVATEKSERVAADQRIEGKADANAQNIAAINDAQNGILAQAKAHVAEREEALQEQIDNKVAQTVYDADIKELQDKDDAISGDVVKLQSSVETLKTQMGEGNFGALDEAVKEAVAEFAAEDERIEGLANAAQAAADKAQEEIDALEEVVGNAEGGMIKDIADLDAAIKAEVQRAGGVEQSLQGEIDDAEGRIAALEGKFEGDESVDSKIQAVQDDLDQFKLDQAGVDQGQDAEIAKKVAIADYEVDKKALQDADVALDERLDVIEGEGEGSIKKAVADEAKLRQEADEALAARVLVNENKLAGLEKDTVQAAIDQAEADAKAHAEQKIADLVDSAPEAMNTLNELAEAIKAHGDEYEAYVSTVSTNIATAKEEAISAAATDASGKDDALKVLLQAEIDADVKEEKERAMAEEADIRADFAAADAALKQELQGEIDADVLVETNRAKGVEEGLQAAIDVLNGDEEGSVNKKVADAVQVEQQRAEGQEALIRQEFAAEDTKLENRIITLEGLVVGGEGQGIEAIIGDVAKNKDDIADLKEADITLQANIDAKVAQAAYDTKVGELEAADQGLGNRIAVFEAGGAQDVAAKEVRLADAEADIETLQTFMNGHSHEQMIADIDANNKAIAQEVLDRKAAIEKEVEDRDAAIEEALEAFSDTNEVKAMLAGVVNSLGLAIEDNKLKLTLGGGDSAVTIKEVTLDMATDDDINGIIAGLDAE